MCKLCSEHIDSQDMIESCQVLNSKYSNLAYIKKIYTSTFDKDNLIILQKIMDERKTLLKLKTTSIDEVEEEDDNKNYCPQGPKCSFTKLSCVELLFSLIFF